MVPWILYLVAVVVCLAFLSYSFAVGDFAQELYFVAEVAAGVALEVAMMSYGVVDGAARDGASYGGGWDGLELHLVVDCICLLQDSSLMVASLFHYSLFLAL